MGERGVGVKGKGRGWEQRWGVSYGKEKGDKLGGGR